MSYENYPAGEAVKKRKTEIYLQIEEAIAIRPRSVISAYCEGCLKLTRMIAPTEAATVSGLTAREVYRLVEAGSLHFVETTEGLLFVCVESLRQCVAGDSSALDGT